MHVYRTNIDGVGAEEGCARQWMGEWERNGDNRDRHTHLYTSIPSQAPPRGRNAVCPFNLCYHIPTVFLFFSPPFALRTPTCSQISGWGGDDPPADHSLTSPRACPRLRSAYWLAGSRWGGWQSGIEGSSLPPFWVDWQWLTAQWPARSLHPPYLPPSRLGCRHGRDIFGWVGLRCVGLQRAFSFFLFSHAHTHTHSHLCLCVARLFIPDRTNGSSMDSRGVGLPKSGSWGLLEWVTEWSGMSTVHDARSP